MGICYPLSFLLGVCGAWVINRFGGVLRLMDHPEDRSSHSSPIPKGAGIGILATWVLTGLALSLPLSYWGPPVMVALGGLYGDRVNLSPAIRLGIQFCAALILMTGGGEAWSFWWIPVWVFFLVGSANFYNFMDGIDGLAGMTGVLAFGLLALWAASIGTASLVPALAICLSLSCLGFLPFNFPRAKVFLGDVGSLLLGFVFATLVFSLSENWGDLLCLASFLFPFYADELTTMAIRLRNGEDLTQPHRRHLYQILANEKGIPHWRVSLYYGSFQLLVGGSALWARAFGDWVLLSVLALYFAGFALVSHQIRSRGLYTVHVQNI